MAHAIPLVSDPIDVKGAIVVCQQRGQGFVILRSINTIDALFLQVADTRRKASTQQGKGGKVNLGVAMRVGKMFFQGQITLIVEQPVQHISGISVCRSRRRLAEQRLT